jgi:2-keto-4-pentenoate hydratase/2-oxohepta-3-ene-1,7-dioic acid hydratase in catechol pathway
MKLIRCGEFGKERPGVLLKDGTQVDVSAFGADYNEEFFASDGIARLAKWLEANQSQCPTFEPNTRYGSCVCRPSKIICVGLNFRDHAAESKLELPKEPIIFFKSTTALVGPNDDVTIPKNSEKTDWEVELAVVIGKRASYIDERDAHNYIAGYALHNDYSERAFQIERSGQWVKGKSCDTFAPLGPVMATQDEVPDVNNLKMWLTVNGKTMQNGTSADMVFKVPFLVSYISQFMTLLPGDVISTGTPAGVGFGFNPPIYLKHGDVVRLGIDCLGESQQRLVAYEGR